MKLNLGCGKRLKKGFINIDISPQVDDVEQGDALNPEFKDKSVTVVCSEHFIEHLTKPELNRFFSECNRILIDGGKLTLIAPSMETSIMKYIEKKQTIKYLENLLFARHLHKHDYHKQGIYKEKLERLCAKYGFSVIKIYYQDRSSLGGGADEIVLEAVKNAQI